MSQQPSKHVREWYLKSWTSYNKKSQTESLQSGTTQLLLQKFLTLIMQSGIQKWDFASIKYESMS